MPAQAPAVAPKAPVQQAMAGSIFFKTSTMLDNKKDRSTPALPQARDDIEKVT
jgi:hypothetical protein